MLVCIGRKCEKETKPIFGHSTQMLPDFKIYKYENN